jgi:hypothetical protein
MDGKKTLAIHRFLCGGQGGASRIQLRHDKITHLTRIIQHEGTKENEGHEEEISE